MEPEKPKPKKADALRAGCGCVVLAIPLIAGLSASGVLPWLTNLWGYAVGGTLAIIIFLMLLYSIGGGEWWEGD